MNGGKSFDVNHLGDPPKTAIRNGGRGDFFFFLSIKWNATTWRNRALNVDDVILASFYILYLISKMGRQFNVRQGCGVS